MAGIPNTWQASGARYLGLSLLIILLDQLSKQWVIRSVTYLYERIEILPFFSIIHVRNPGAAFSFLSNQGGWQAYLFGGLALVMSIVLAVLLRRQPKEMRRSNLAFALIIGGALGNLIDRVLHGAVIDFLDFYLGTLHWPAFNIADSAIVIGAVTLVLDGFLTGKTPNKS